MHDVGPEGRGEDCVVEGDVRTGGQGGGEGEDGHHFVRSVEGGPKGFCWGGGGGKRKRPPSASGERTDP